MAESLNKVERRVFGVLLEKALAQPQYYPMTVNAIVTGCNQKSNRDPVMQLDEDAVWNTLEVLRAGGLVTRLLPGGASRVERFRHETKEIFAWEKPQRAVMAELLLRGPQTVGELRAHCTRMFPFENTEAVEAVLENLGQEDPPRVAALPRTPGRSAVRYAHRLCSLEEWEQIAGGAMDVAATEAESEDWVEPARETEMPGVIVESLRDELADVQEEMAELHEAVTELRRRLEALEG